MSDRGASAAARLAVGEVHVWRFEADAAASRFVLRRLLAEHLGLDPAALPLAGDGEARRGGVKPRFGPGSGCEWLRFNLSHSGGLALVALAREREVGVDVERIAVDRDPTVIAERFFSDGERAALRALDRSPERRAAAFFRLWTRKEAYLKATGDGLAGLEEADLSAPRPGWSIHDLDVGDGYAAAVACEGEAPAIVLRRLP